MKVTTDGCLFGALQPHLPNGGAGKKILDIGAGTGLLSLMAAQLNPAAALTAIEIEPAAALEAAGNAAGSPFGNRIRVIQQDVRLFEPECEFDLIICNPPFYEKQLQSPDTQRKMAHHADTLSLNLLISLIPAWLHAQGVFSLLLPFYREEEALRLVAKQQLYCHRLIRVRQTPKHPFFRSIFFMGKAVKETSLEEMTIKAENNRYSPEFRELLLPFYLKL